MGVVHNRRVMHESFELIEHARRRLKEQGLPCTIAGGASDAAIDAAEEALACTFPPSYRAFLRSFGAVTMPARVSTIPHLIGLDAKASEGDAEKDVVQRTLHARVENRLSKHLVIVGLGTEAGEWFCIDVDRVGADGESPIVLFDARDNQLDQQFYDDFASMVNEVLTFVLETLDESSDLGSAARDESSGMLELG